MVHQYALSAAEGSQLASDLTAPNLVIEDDILEEPEEARNPPVLDNARTITCYICCGYDYLAVDCQKYK